MVFSTDTDMPMYKCFILALTHWTVVTFVPVCGATGADRKHVQFTQATLDLARRGCAVYPCECSGLCRVICGVASRGWTGIERGTVQLSLACTAVCTGQLENASYVRFINTSSLYEGTF